MLTLILALFFLKYQINHFINFYEHRKVVKQTQLDSFQNIKQTQLDSFQNIKQTQLDSFQNILITVKNIIFIKKCLLIKQFYPNQFYLMIQCYKCYLFH